MKNVIFLCAFALSATTTLAADRCQNSVPSPASVSVFETTMGSNGKVTAFQEKKALNLDVIPDPPKNGKDGSPIVFEIDPSVQKQKMEGYGAAFTESCTMQVTKLSPELRQELMQKMFSREKGAGFSMMRLPMGSTDFSDPEKGNYTYDDTRDNAPDPEFKFFDMSRDEATFEMIREAVKINPELKVMISPWSAPAWMKDSKKINGGRLLPEHYQNFANYFVKVIREYEKRGIPVTALSIQNEPFFDWNGVPSMGMNVEEQIKFIGEYLGPTLEKNGIQKRIYAHDHNWGGAEDANKVIDDKVAGKYVGGAAFHCYGGSQYNMLDTMRPHPGLPILQTECTATDDRRYSAADTFQFWADTQAAGAVRMGTVGTIAWNLCLNQKHGPNNWSDGMTGCKNCRGLATIDSSKKKTSITFHPEYYALAQVSRYIDSSFRHVATEDEWKSKKVLIAPFVNPEGKFVLAAQNMTAKAATIQVRFPDCRSFTYKMPAGAGTTFRLQLEAKDPAN